jgi:two-component system, LuxR family, response regulator FixJ
MNTDLTVSIVDDAEYDRFAMARILARVGFQVHEYYDAASFLQQLDVNRVGCAVVDLRMPGMDGAALQRALHDDDLSIPLVLVSGVVTVKIATDAMRLGAIDVLEKPIDQDRLVEIVRQGMEQSHQAIHRRQLAGKVKQELSTLTPKEREVLPFVCSGYSLKEITSHFGFGITTAARHQSRILEKLNSSNPLQLVRKFQLAEIRFES